MAKLKVRSASLTQRLHLSMEAENPVRSHSDVQIALQRALAPGWKIIQGFPPKQHSGNEWLFILEKKERVEATVTDALTSTKI